MSTQLHQAVQLAQAGNRVEARQLLLLFLQTEPNNEVAWLWLASVASDQAEYQRALNEVLRINPGNQRTQQLLSEFQQQQFAPPSYTPSQQQQPVSPPPPQYGVPQTPPPAQYGIPQQQPVTPPPPYGGPQTPPPPQYGAPYTPPKPVEVQVKTVQKRRGCLGCSVPGCAGCLGCGGCGQGCILAFLLLVIVPIVICGGLSLSPTSLGPLDLPASYLPGQMGRKEIKFDADSYNVSLKAPRSWYLVTPNDQMWGFWSDALEGTVPFETTPTTLTFGDNTCSVENWQDLETCTGMRALIVDTNPAIMTEHGDMISLVLDSGSVEGNFSCETVQAAQAGKSYGYPAFYKYKNDLCGYREEDRFSPGPTASVFKTIDPPQQERVIIFYTPVTATSAARWRISMPEKVYDTYADDITALIKSVSIKQN